MFEEFDMLIENFDRAIMETITYKGQTLAQWESGEAEQDETAHESIRSEREARAALYAQTITEGREIEYIHCTQTLTS